MKNKDNRIAVVTHAPFPNGNVSTMRYTSYMKALAEFGVFCYVLIYCPTRMAANIKQSSGVFENINFQYATDITWKKYNILCKAIYLFKGLFNSVSYLNKQKINTVILYGDNLFIVNLFYWIYCKITNKKFIGDRSELPSVEIRNSKLKMFVYGMKQRMFDGMIIMTRQLMQFYRQYSKKEDFLYFLPMTIVPSRFDGIKKDIKDSPYIAVVFGTHNRDGLLESLKSFELYCKKGGKYNLWLIGDYKNMPNYSELDFHIKSSEYTERIFILGRLANDKVPGILYNASILLTTPNSYISGGFPTKLGEYMLSGVPIVATKAGELLDYIVPDMDMLMSNPGDINNISDNLLRVENDISLAKTLADNAKKKALRVFCADSYIKSLLLFLTK